jgi:lysyl-tRNA synthetase class 2
MTNEHLGRVIDTWKSPSGEGVVVDTGTEIIRIISFAPLKAGALVQFEHDGIAPQQLRVLSVPDQWDPSGDASRWLGGRRECLRSRHRTAHAIRGWFMDEGFLEVETPLLVPGMAPDPHLDPIGAGGGYLVTSTEYQLKRMFVGGFSKAYTLTKNFRKGEKGRFHNPEFTMLEWGRVGGSLEQIESDARAFIQTAASTIGSSRTLSWNGRQVDVMAPSWQRVDLLEALKYQFGISISTSFDVTEVNAELARAKLLREGTPVPQNRFEAVSILVDMLQPHLGHPVPTFLRGWPAFLTPSSETLKDDPSIADRSELFIAGVELADGFAFARDASVQRERFEAAHRARKELGTPPVVVDERYLKAIESGLAPGAGMAMGFDRLVMLLTGASEIRDVLAFAWDER